MMVRFDPGWSVGRWESEEEEGFWGRKGLIVGQTAHPAMEDE